MEEPTCSRFTLLSSEIGNDDLIYQKPKRISWQKNHYQFQQDHCMNQQQQVTLPAAMNIKIKYFPVLGFHGNM